MQLYRGVGDEALEPQGPVIPAMDRLRLRVVVLSRVEDEVIVAVGRHLEADQPDGGERDDPVVRREAGGLDVDDECNAPTLNFRSGFGSRGSDRPCRERTA